MQTSLSGDENRNNGIGKNKKTDSQPLTFHQWRALGIQYHHVKSYAFSKLKTT
jgi:hypothetical protein